MNMKVTTFYLQEITLQRINAIKKINHIKTKSSVIKKAIDLLYESLKSKEKECMTMEMLIEKIKLTLDSLELDTKTRNNLDLTLESMQETMQDINENFKEMKSLYKNSLNNLNAKEKKQGLEKMPKSLESKKDSSLFDKEKSDE